MKTQVCSILIVCLIVLSNALSAQIQYLHIEGKGENIGILESFESGDVGLELIRSEEANDFDWRILNENGIFRIQNQRDDFLTNGTNRLSILENGYVGIGTSIPNVELTLASTGTNVSLTGGGIFQIGNFSSTNIIMDTNDIQCRNNGVESRLYVQREGGVLDIGGDTDITGDVILRSTGGNFTFRVAPPGITAGDLHIIGDNDEVHMSINDQNGRVGLGTIEPATRLNIVGNSDVSSSGGGLIQLGTSAGANIGFDNNEIQARNNSVASTLSLQNSGGLLDIGDDTDIDGDLILRSNGGTFRLRTAPSGSNTGDLHFVGDGDDVKMSIDDSNGRVGIGTTSPATILNVVGGTDVTGTTGGYIQLGESGENNLGIDNNEIQCRNNGTPQNMFIQASGGDLLLCNSANGSVGIGITNAANIPNGYLLAVDGNVIAEEIRVELSADWWPDYVFENDYDLRTIEDLEKSIQENGHLPGIPSAKSLEEEGLNLGDMQKRMMEKIEELSLYIIQQNKEIKTLQEQVILLNSKTK